MAIQNKVESPLAKQPPAAPQPTYQEPTPLPEPVSAEELVKVKARITELTEQVGVVTATYQHLPMSEAGKALEIALAPIKKELMTLRLQVKANNAADLDNKRRLSAKKNAYVAQNLDKALAESIEKHGIAQTALNAHRQLIRQSEEAITSFRMARLNLAAEAESILDDAATSENSLASRKRFLANKNELDAIVFDQGVEEKRLANLKAALQPFVDAERTADFEMKAVRNQKDYQAQNAALSKAVVAYGKALGLTDEAARMNFARAVSNAVSAGTLPSGVY
jgi:hypothetical protein